MKLPMIVLALVATVLGGIWYRVDRVNAALLQIHLDAPFREYAQKHAGNLRYGQIAPDFALEDASGKVTRLSEVCRGSRLTLVGSYRANSEPSLRQLIDLREAYDDLHARGLAVCVLTSASRGEMSGLGRDYKLPYPVLFDLGESALRKLGMSEVPFSLLLRSDRRVVFLSSGYQARSISPAIIDKAALELTGNRIGQGAFGPGPNALPPFSRQNPLALNDLDGSPRELPVEHPTALVVFSTQCPTCLTTYQRLSHAWTAAEKPPLVVVLVDSASQVSGWLDKDQKRKLAGAEFLMDPADLTRHKLSLKYYGGAALLDENGAATHVVTFSEGPEYEAGLMALFRAAKKAGKGGDATVH